MAVGPARACGRPRRGGDRGGRQSAALLACQGPGVRGHPARRLDLSVDDTPIRFAGLARLRDVQAAVRQHPKPAALLDLAGDLPREVRGLLAARGHPPPPARRPRRGAGELGRRGDFEERMVHGRTTRWWLTNSGSGARSRSRQGRAGACEAVDGRGSVGDRRDPAAVPVRLCGPPEPQQTPAATRRSLARAPDRRGVPSTSRRPPAQPAWRTADARWSGARARWRRIPVEQHGRAGLRGRGRTRPPPPAGQRVAGSEPGRQPVGERWAGSRGHRAGAAAAATARRGWVASGRTSDSGPAPWLREAVQRPGARARRVPPPLLVQRSAPSRGRPGGNAPRRTPARVDGGSVPPCSAQGRRPSWEAPAGQILRGAAAGFELAPHGRRAPARARVVDEPGRAAGPPTATRSRRVSVPPRRNRRKPRLPARLPEPLRDYRAPAALAQVRMVGALRRRIGTPH